jgi:choline dehydrogenase-like flavoprotein
MAADEPQTTAIESNAAPDAASKLSTFLSRKYDVVVIGGGTAGLAIAARLTEDPSVQVAILEAGEEHLADPRILTPGFVSTLTGDPSFDWDFKSVPQKHLHDRRIGHPRGKVLGGSSAINYMMATYPSTHSLDMWVPLTGSSLWNFSSLAPYYRKFQTFHNPTPATAEQLETSYIDSAIQGTNGPIHTSFYEGAANSPWQPAWNAAFGTLKKTLTTDPLSGVATGGFNNPATLDPTTATRSYAANAYYTPNAARPNLHLLTGAHVEKIIFSSSDSTPTATAVRFTHTSSPDTPQTLSFTREVILSAGAIQSPQLLELSGIGSPSLLATHSIPVIHANPAVGENLKDHMAAGFSKEVAAGAPSLDAFRDPAMLNAALTMYATEHTGPFAGGVSCSAFLPTPSADMPSLIAAHPDPASTPPHIARQNEIYRTLLANPDEPSAHYFLLPAQLDGRKAADAKTLLQPTQEGDYCTIAACLSYPLSRGSVHIASADPRAHPVIDPQYLSNELDLELYARHILYLEELTETEPLRGLFKEGGRRVPRGPDAEGKTSPVLGKRLETLDEAKEFLRLAAVTQYHPVGTGAIGVEADGGVVDERLRVHGVKGVRVVDASVCPGIVRGNVVSLVYAIAERAADLIKEEWAGKA